MENYSTGSARKGNRVWYIRLKAPDQEEFDQQEMDLLPDELPIPFD